MADTPPTPPAAKPATAAKSSTPQNVKMHRAVHEVLTGPKPEQKIEPGTLITDEVAKEHKLDAKALTALTDSGALDMVDVLKG